MHGERTVTKGTTPDVGGNSRMSRIFSLFCTHARTQQIEIASLVIVGR